MLYGPIYHEVHCCYYGLDEQSPKEDCLQTEAICDQLFEGYCHHRFYQSTLSTYRGLIPITIMRHIEKSCGQPMHKLFDFVCGTSTGALLAALLCLEKMSAEHCKEYYLNFSTEVFKMNNLLGISHFFRNHAFYDAKLLERLIRSVMQI